MHHNSFQEGGLLNNIKTGKIIRTGTYTTNCDLRPNDVLLDRQPQLGVKKKLIPRALHSHDREKLQ